MMSMSSFNNHTYVFRQAKAVIIKNKSTEHIPPTCVDTSDSVLSIFIVKFSLNVSMESSVLLADLINDLFSLGYAYF